jgi:fatty-acyl-CoA synthase
MQKSLRSSSDATKDWIRALETTKRLFDPTCPGLQGIVQAQAANDSGRAALIGEQCALSYAELAGRANRYSRWALRQGLRSGDVVGLLMSNQPEFVAIWLGLTQVGCVAALLNPQLSMASLARAFDEAAVRAAIGDSAILRRDHTEAISPTCRWWGYGDGHRYERVDSAAAALPDEPLAGDERHPVALQSPALLVFTSGTTGYPKAVNITHSRILEWSGWFAGMMNATNRDRLYNCLPMYHSVGGIAAVGSMLVAGGSVVIRDRFSVSQFWPDVARSGATIFQYIGELCRYLVQADSCDDERRHGLRLACGNGLRADVWERFQQRFGIPQVLEFYAASEGCVSLTNAEGKVGSVGRVPPFLVDRYPIALVRLDPVSGQPRRGADGLSIKCGPDEHGELIGRTDGTSLRFDGYTDAAATEARYLHDVFAKGDRWFRTGDLMKQDAAGYCYFIDRLGDTYRYKGENVSTTEVAAIIQSCDGVADAVAYGVSLPGVEGKAGMAALVVDERFSLSTLQAHLAVRLPSYARPLFIRICGNLDATATFRLRKVEYARQGYEVSVDPVWFFDAEIGRYVPCDVRVVRELERQTVKL